MGQCEKCGREVGSHHDGVLSERRYVFCNECVTAVVKKVWAQCGAQISDRGALAALESELFGYASREFELAAGAELEPSVRRSGGDVFAQWSTDYAGGER